MIRPTIATLVISVGAVPAHQGPDLTRQDTYAVYSTVLRDRFIVARTSRIVVDDSTASAPDVSDADHRQRWERFWTSVFASHPVLSTAIAPDLQQRFLSPPPRHGLAPERFVLPVPVAVFGAAERATLRRWQDSTGVTEYWSAFNLLFPDRPGRMVLYPVVFDSTGTRALIEVHRRCGPRCGRHVLFYVQRSAGEWRIVEEVVLSIS
jgi:hypothetical protein